MPWLYDTIYAYLGPILLSIGTSTFLIPEKNREQPIFSSGIRNFINWLGKYSFEYYMIHPFILFKLAGYINAPSAGSLHMLILLWTFVISITISVMMHLYAAHIVEWIDDCLDNVFYSKDKLYWKKIAMLFAGVFCLIFSVFSTFK